MNPPFEVRYLPTAEKDLNEIFDYVLKNNPGAAAALLDKFDDSIAQLSHHPEMGVVPRDERLSRLGYRMLVIGKYLVFYVVKPKIVQIRRIIRGARQYQFLL